MVWWYLVNANMATLMAALSYYLNTISAHGTHSLDHASFQAIINMFVCKNLNRSFFFFLIDKWAQLHSHLFCSNAEDELINIT